MSRLSESSWKAVAGSRDMIVRAASLVAWNRIQMRESAGEIASSESHSSRGAN